MSENTRNGLTNPKVWIFTSGTNAAYNMTQVNEQILDGDVLIVPNQDVVGFMCKAWPTRLTSEGHSFHKLPDKEAIADEYAKTFELAEEYMNDVTYRGVIDGRGADITIKVINRNKLTEIGILVPFED